MNPEYEYRLYTDAEMETDMREWYPELMPAWGRMRPVEKVCCGQDFLSFHAPFLFMLSLVCAIRLLVRRVMHCEVGRSFSD